MARSAETARATTRPLLSAKWIPSVAFGAAFLPALLLYLRTLAPTVLVGDMAEFQFTGYILGVPHPTGYPLLTLLSKLFTLLPFGDVAYRVNLSSAVYMTAAAGLIAAIITLLLTRAPGETVNGPAAWVAAVWGVACGWLFAVAGTVWDQAVLARSYALNALLVTAIILVLLLYWLEGRRRWFCAFWLLLGLSFAHHGTTITLLPAYLVFIAYCLLHNARGASQLERERDLGDTPNTPSRGLLPPVPPLIALAPLGLVLGLTPYLLFAYRFVFGYSYYWGNPQTWADVWYLLRGTPFQGQVFAYPLTLDSQMERSGFGLAQLADQFGWVGAAGALLGLFLLLFTRRRPVAALLLLIWLGNFIFAINYGIIGDIYLIPGYVVAAICIGLLTLPLIRFSATLPRALLALAPALLIAVLAARLAGERLPAHDLSGDTTVAALAQTTLHEAAPNATIYVDWEAISTLRYYQYAEQRRRDLKLESGNPDAWDEEIAADLAAGRPAYVGGFAGRDPPQAVRDGFVLARAGLVYRVMGAK